MCYFPMQRTLSFNTRRKEEVGRRKLKNSTVGIGFMLNFIANAASGLTREKNVMDSVVLFLVDETSFALVRVLVDVSNEIY